MIQGVINRLASTSACFKGFAVTIWAGVLAMVLSQEGQNVAAALCMACFGIFLIGCFDAWYFKMEYRYRKLYALVLEGKHAIDFDMRNDVSIAVGWREAFGSKAVRLFYGLLIVAYAILGALRIYGVI